MIMKRKLLKKADLSAIRDENEILMIHPNNVVF